MRGRGGGRMRQRGMGFTSMSMTTGMHGLRSGWMWWMGAGSSRGFCSRGSSAEVRENVLSPKPVSKPRPTLYAGGESETAKNLIAAKCDAYLMHGDAPEAVGAKVAAMVARR